MLSKRKKPAVGSSRAQWVLVVPAAALAPEGEQQAPAAGGGGPVFARLRHPCTGEGALFLLSGPTRPLQQLWELRSLEEQPCSWLVGQGVQRDGRLLYATPMDPLFLALPYLRRGGQAKFQPLGQLLLDAAFPACSLLAACPRLLQGLPQLAEERQVGGQAFYRYSQERALGWLGRKVQQAAGALRAGGVCVGTGVHSASYRRSQPVGCTQQEDGEGDYARYAHGLISDYLPQELSLALAQHLQLPPRTPPPKRKRPEGEGQESPVQATEDYTKENAPPQRRRGARGKLTAAQKALAKVDKTGMKTMASFFTTKSKGPK